MTPDQLKKMFPNASPSFLKENALNLKVTPKTKDSDPTKEDVPPILGRLGDALGVDFAIIPSTDEERLNKTERAYLTYLRHCNMPWIGIQCVTLKLGDDTRYTCDFYFLNEEGRLCGHEVKGFFRDDAKVKIKVAARMYRWIDFSVVKKVNNGWKVKPVKP